MVGRIFIDGEAGTTGLGIANRLRNLDVGLIRMETALRKDRDARLDAMRGADLVVLCLPDEAAREAAAMVESLGEHGPRLLDASSAHRVSQGWTYGFPELGPHQPVAITTARRVSNPGCYATGAIALLRPLVDAGLVPSDFPISINAVSGYSGGGRAMIEAHEASGGPAFSLYALGLAPKQVAEIERHSGLTRPPLFVPSVGHFAQGMIVSIPLHLDQLPGRPSPAALREALAAHYRGALLVGVEAAEASLDPAALAGTDRLALRVHANEARGHVLLTASLDNLGKGASGAAVQCIDLMLGLETAEEAALVDAAADA